MSYFYEPPRRPSLFFIFMVAVIGAVIGGAVVAALTPTYLADAIYERVADRLPPQQSPIEVDVAAVSPAVAAAERVGPAVVGIVNRQLVQDFWGRRTVEESGGAGVIIDREGHIVTNYHVVSGAEELLVFLSDGTSLPARVVGGDRLSDLAVLQVEGRRDLPVAEFGDSDALKVGEFVVAIGNPLSVETFQRTVTAGVIAGLDRRIEVQGREMELIQTDAAINPGNSGGPLVNARGEVIGINTLKFAAEQVEGMGFAIPSNVAKPIIEDLIEFGYVQRPYIGVGVYGPAQARLFLGVEMERGVLVVEVVPGGPADQAGVQRGDIILAVDDEELEEAADLGRIIRDREVGDEVTLTIDRGGELIKVKVVLGRVPPDLYN